MKKLLLALTTVVILAGCASGGNQAYQAAHDSASKRGIAEANARVDSEKTLAMAAASIGKSCADDTCRMGALMTLASLKAATGAAIQSAAPVIQAPVNEALEWAKVIVGGATSLYGIRVNGAISLVNATRGAANIDAAKAGLDALDVYRDTTTAK